MADIQYMQAACAEARKWLGATSPNPAVGAVAVNAQGEIIGRAAHHRAGEAHAEALLIETLRAQGKLDQVHTLFVTLEPCNHHGRTPPCSDAILKAGIKRVVIGTRDPNKLASGGIGKLCGAGIEVTLQDDEECKQLIHAFAFHAQTGKPWVTVKRALDKNSSMIPPVGQKTFTSENSLRLAHRLRKKADAIITGSGTILADNPEFTVRHVADYPDKKRWLGILDRRGRVPPSYSEAARRRGLEPILYKDIQQAVDDLTARGGRDILVEAGPALSQAVLDSPLWTLSVTIRATHEDIIETAFNPREKMPFDMTKFRWDYFLPAT